MRPNQRHQVVIDDGGINRVVHGRHGYFAYNKHDVYIGRSIEKYGEFSEQEADLFHQICRPGDVVVEVGANIGAHTVGLAKRVGPAGMVVAFEPQTMAFQLLATNVAINSLTNVQCLKMAVGDRTGQTLVPQPALDQTNNFGGVSLENVARGEQVPLVTLDSILQVGRMRLLKVDVEGMERQVISGATDTISRLRPALYVENDRPERSRKLIETIAGLGYELFWHTPPLFNPNNFAGDPENIFQRIVSVNMLCVPRETAPGISGLKPICNFDEHPLIKRQSS
jgi:FkbM family methyltransferase